MRIGFIEDTPLHGGTQIWVTEANRYFLAQGEEVTVLAPHDTWVANEVGRTAARVCTYDWEGVTREDEESRKIWIDALADCDVAVCTVHPPRRGFHCSVFGARCISEGGLDTHLIPKTGTVVPEYLREFYVPRVDINWSVIAITGFTRDTLIDRYQVPPDKARLIYQGTEVSRFSPSDAGRAAALERYPLPDGAGPVLGCIGSFEERKGQSVLFETVKQLAGGPLPNVHAMLVGDGPDEQMLKEKVAAMGLGDHVTFFPFTREPDVVFERLDITVLSSLFKEGLPNVLLESMAMGVPVVASRMAGVPEIVLEGETGYMAEPGDAAGLAAGIEKLWSGRENLERMGSNARRLVTENHDKDGQFQHFLSYFREVRGVGS